MKILIFNLFLFYVLSNLNPHSNAIQSNRYRYQPVSSSMSPRGSIITFVRFLNAPCTSPNGRMTGICFSLNDCVKMQGTQIGTCASGFGVCCIYRRTCGIMTNQNITYFTNPGFPGEFTEPSDSSCTLTLLRPPRPPICQVRLDFREFDLAPPTDGNCVQDQLVITGQNINHPVPVLCGYNTGQHLYLNVENSYTPIMLNINTRGEYPRRWNIKATYLECTNPSRAPNNCLQYYKGASGMFTSFNYRSNQSPAQGGGYLNNLNYAICFRKEAGQCSITFASKPGENFLLLNLNMDEAPTVEGGEAGLGIEECPGDYIRLGGDRYCGARLNPSTSSVNPTVNVPVTDSSTGPFIVQFVTDGMVNAVGFALQYMQNPCNN